ncbi:MAG: NAD kinase [Nitrospirales bacterium]|nr:MAG: NAD kinase [Nitrospirales bacterium]
MSGTSVKTIGILTKPQSDNIRPVLKDIVEWLNTHDKNVILDTPTTIELRTNTRNAQRTQIANEADLLIVLGGDGTMLHAARLVEKRSVPILGVNMGGLGFLTETTVDHIYDSLTKIFADDFLIEKRVMLRAKIHRGQHVIGESSALNDVVVNKGHLARMIAIKVCINGSFMTNLRGDGLIIATPTGSTGYSLSANGPILDPSLDVFTLNPICPHTLSHRPFIVPSHASISVTLTSQENAMATLDGQIGFELTEDDTIHIYTSEHQAHLIRFPGRSYYDVLRNKLKWGDG